MKNSVSGSVPEDEAGFPAGNINECSSRRAQLQLITVGLCMLSFVIVALVAIFSFQKLQRDEPSDGSTIEYDGLTYERIEDTDEIKKLGLSTPLTGIDCGAFITTISKPEALKGCSAYHLNDNKSQALMLVNIKNTYTLYRFCYFINAYKHKGQDILDVCGSNTDLVSIACSGVDRDSGTAGEWEKTLTDAASLNKFEQLFGALTPQEDKSDVLATIQQSDTWDAMVTLRYKNGLTYDIVLYNKLKAATGFRCVYDIPEELVKLLGQK